TTLGLSSEASASEEEDGPLIQALGRRQQQVVSLLRSAPRSTLTLSRLKKRYAGPPSGLSAALRSLEREGLVTRRTELPTPRSKPQQERIIRLAVDASHATDALNDAARRAPLQAAALSWLIRGSGRLPSVAGTGDRGPGRGLLQDPIPVPRSPTRKGGWLRWRAFPFT